MGKRIKIIYVSYENYVNYPQLLLNTRKKYCLVYYSPTVLTFDNIYILAGAKKIKPATGKAWEYAKIEIVPPMTIAFFRGPAGKSLEATFDKFGNAIIGIMEAQVRSMDAAAARKKKAKEDAIKAADAKIKAKAAAEAKAREAEAKKAEAEKAAKVAKAEKEKKPEPKKEEPKKEEPKKK